MRVSLERESIREGGEWMESVESGFWGQCAEKPEIVSLGQ